jgi:hypothetical protein
MASLYPRQRASSTNTTFPQGFKNKFKIQDSKNKAQNLKDPVILNLEF